MSTKIAAILLGIILASPCQAAVTLATMKKDADKVMAEVSTKLATAQSQYFLKNGRYWQGIVLMDSVPFDGIKQTADFNKRPTDQAESWQDVNVKTLIAELPVCIQVDVYDGPQGKGYVLVGTFGHSGKRYQKAIGFGPENRTHGWVQVSDGIH